MSNDAAAAPEPTVPPPTVTADEDAGRLTHASKTRIWVVMIALVAFVEVIPMQYSVVSLIIPKIGLAFPSSGANATWSLTIIGVVGAATLPLCGKISDLFGKKRTLLVLGALLMIGTLISAVTSNWAVFLVGRGLMGTSFCMSAVAYGAVRDLMPRRMIPVMMGVVATGFGASSILAPVIGGLLTDHYSWRSVFWFVLIYVAVTGPVLAFVMPESPYRVKQRLDVLGALLIGFGLAGALIYVSEGSSWGWGGSNLIYLVGGLVLLVAFCLWENHIDYPLMELRMLRTPVVAIAMTLSLLATWAIALPNLLISYMFETPKPSALKAQVLAGISAKEHVPVSLISQFVHFQGDINYAAGFSIFQLAWHITIFLSVAAMILGPVGGLLARRYGSRAPLILSGVVLLLAFALWTFWHGAWVWQATIGLLWGAGYGLYYAGGPNLLVDVIPAQRQGISAGMAAAFGSIGSALAIALATPILAAHPFQLVATPPGSKPVVSDIPQVYTNTAFTLNYLLLGVPIAIFIIILAVVLRAGRTPARGGILGEDAAPVAAALIDAGAGVLVESGASVGEDAVHQATRAEAPALEATTAEVPAQEAPSVEAPVQETASTEA